jgi:Kef-type K+ transport system membrane component KefB
LEVTGHPIVVVLAIAVAAALLAEIRIGKLRVPVVVWEMLFGILIGPQVLGLVKPGGLLSWMGETPGLAALFFMAGLDLDLQKVKGRPLILALRGWVLSLGLALALGFVLHSLPGLGIPLMVGLVLTTTAMGTFLPMLRDAGHLDSGFGTYVLAAGAVGEFAPIIVVSLVLTHEYGAWQQVALMLVFAAIALAAALIALGLRPPKALALLERSMHSSTQLPIALSILLLASFDLLSKKVGLESVLGAFAAGMVVGLASQGEAGKLFRQKTEALCFGFFVPFFFVVSGITLDLRSLLQSPKSMLLVPLFLLLFLVVRGAPVFLYGKDDIPKQERLPLALYSATALPMVVAITNIEARTGDMPSNIAAALVGAAVLSVLLFPAIGEALLSKRAPAAAGTRAGA